MKSPHYIQQTFKEIEVYSSHALYDLAKQKCVELADLIKRSDQFKSKDVMLEAIGRKIRSIEEAALYFDGIGKSMKMSEKELDIVKKMILGSVAPDTNAEVWAVARACMVLGQYDEALQEFDRLIDNKYKLVPTAKNVLRCLIGMSGVDDAIARYRKWYPSEKFSLEQLENIRTFLQEILNKKNISETLPKPETDKLYHDQDAADDEFIDILSVKLCRKNGANKALASTLDVTYQEGAKINVVVSKKNAELLDYLQPGREIKKVEFFTASIIYTDSCLVSEKRQIVSGSKKGDYSVSMTVVESD